MFKKKAEEYADKKICQEYTDGCMGFYKCKEDCERYHNTQKYWQDGAEFGYNKATEWHYVKDGDLPEVDNRIVLCICGNGYIDGKRNSILRLLTRKDFPFFQPVIAWKEIVLPELPKENE